MIGMIGGQDDVIGFGLAGIAKLQELPDSATAEEILAAVESMRENLRALIITERLLRRVEGRPELEGLLVITVPEEKGDAEDRVAQLAKELLGITLEQP